MSATTDNAPYEGERSCARAERPRASVVLGPGDECVRAPSASGRCFNAERSGTAGATINKQLGGLTEAGEARVLRPTQVNGH